MLIIKKSAKTEMITELLQSYLAQVSQKVGIFDEKQGVAMSHSLLDVDFFNLVCGFKEPANVLNVASLLELAKSQGPAFLWMCHESNIHLTQYLKKQGLSSRANIQGLYRSISSELPTYDNHPAVTMVEVTTEEHFYEWCHVFATCHGLTDEVVETYFRPSFGEEGACDLFLAQVYQKSIASSAMYIKNQQCLMLWDAVLPAYRRQGVGSMMLLERMKLAKEAGCNGVYAFGLYAMLETLKGLGFKSFAKFNLLRCSRQNQDDMVADDENG